ncbi:S-layer homology domain-containing protein [Paenibacillus soyae]|uniref:S-layer homology domain-containing protein n=1 Tax=Paenibacillus soyae TaxID=2969249 RepID=A0A9X2MTP0_9BACL|nr:S-layer homology domain-containing protein [Paenibacillus soyae]MCR2806102.1 S-layer homology domain-containing protein [Paenibacillus soyae]
MLQLKRTVLLAMFAIVVSLSAFIVWSGFSSVYASERAVVTKTFQLSEDVETLTLTVEGYDGSFGSRLELPDGHEIKGKDSTRILGADRTYWATAYTISPARKGDYTITIDAPVKAFYNLIVDVPHFSDTALHWAKADIDGYVERGIVKGYGNGKFGPEDAVTGEAFIKMLVLALTEEQPNGLRQWSPLFRWKMKDEEKSLELGWKEYDFLRETSGEWSAPYVSAAADLGITSRWEEKQLRAPFKRKDAALLCANIMNLLAVDKPKVASFNDVSKLEKEYMAAINLVSSQSIISGYPDRTFRPEALVTRAETIKILTRLEAFLK